MSVKKPLTHCEKYGHTWEASTANGYEVCAYRDGSGKPCGAARRTPGIARTQQQRTTTQAFTTPDVQQSMLWS